MIRAVIFDLGGVVLGSPLGVIAEYESEMRLRSGTVNATVVAKGRSGAWARYERAEIDRATFIEDFSAEAGVDAGELLRRIEAAIVPRQIMLDALIDLRARGYLVAALTNNWAPLADSDLVGFFDVVVESSAEGVRKPELGMYEIVLARLRVEAAHAVFLDDIGANLKPARRLGMHTIKVTDPGEALAELESVLSSSA